MSLKVNSRKRSSAQNHQHFFDESLSVSKRIIQYLMASYRVHWNFSPSSGEKPTISPRKILKWSSAFDHAYPKDIIMDDFSPAHWEFSKNWYNFMQIYQDILTILIKVKKVCTLWPSDSSSRNLFYKYTLMHGKLQVFCCCCCLFLFGYPGSSLLLWLFSSCGKWEPLSPCGVWASHCSGFSCFRAQALGLTGDLSTWAWLLRGMWNLPGSGIEFVSPNEVLILFICLNLPSSLWDLMAPSRNWTQVTGNESSES